MDNPYIPKLIPESDLAMFKRSGMGGEDLPGKNPAVLVVDMTKGFVEDPFPLACSATGIPVAKNIRDLLDAARPLGVPVFFSRGFPTTNKAENGAWGYKKAPAKSDAVDLMNTEEAYAIVDILKPQPDEVVITKAKPSVFFGTQLVSMLVYYHIDTLIITGMVTSGCVRATVVDAFSYNYRILVPVECVGDRGQISHEVSLFDIGQKYGNVWPEEKVVEYLRSLK